MKRGGAYKDNLKQHLLVDLHELLIPLLDIRGLLARVRLLIGGLDGIVAVMIAPLDDLLENGLVNLRSCQQTFLDGAKPWRRRRTLGIGIADPPIESSPKSSSMLRIKTERSATARSVELLANVWWQPDKKTQMKAKFWQGNLPTSTVTPSLLWSEIF